MAESKGCAKAFRRVTRGEPESTCSPGRELSNMRDWVATLEKYFTHRERRAYRERKKVQRRATERKVGQTFVPVPRECLCYFLAAVALAAASAYFLVKRSTRPAVSSSFCLPVKKGWQFEQISTRSISPLIVERVEKLFPQAQCTVTG